MTVRRMRGDAVRLIEGNYMLVLKKHGQHHFGGHYIFTCAAVIYIKEKNVAVFQNISYRLMLTVYGDAVFPLLQPCYFGI